MQNSNKPNNPSPLQGKGGRVSRNQSQSNRNQQNNRGQQRGGGGAARAARRSREMATKQTSRHRSVSDADKAALQLAQRNTGKSIFDPKALRVIPLGGQDGIGNKNMLILEYDQDAIVVDCGNNLGIDLPGINYSIPDITYLESIKHKVRGYVFTHGHLDHIGGFKHIYAKVPAPVYGTLFTLGMLEKQFETGEVQLNKFVLNSDNHDRVKAGAFMVESVRVTHAIPDCSLMIIDTPVGKLVHTGDFRLDPEPLDRMPTDIARIKQISNEGVLLLFSDSTNAKQPGRTETEHTLRQSFKDIITQASGRVIVSYFSSNMNRTQMTIDAAVAAGRKVAIDGRGMLSAIELAVKLGYIKIPMGTIVPIRDISKLQDNNVLVICTGGQGEENAALVRMARGEHQNVKLKAGDTVVISSNPIPGNEIAYQAISANLSQIGVHLFRSPTHVVDGCGPLHVSGHANREEQAEMIQMVRPRYFMPVHGDALDRRYHQKVATETGMSAEQALMVNNGDVLEFRMDGSLKQGGRVPVGALLVDQTGAIVPDLVVHDRLLMGEDGIVVVVLTLDRKGVTLSSPDIITRGFIYIKDNEELMNELRNELRRFTIRRFNRVEINRFKQELRDHVANFLFKHTERSPIIIPVVNVVNGNKPAPKLPAEDKTRVPQSTPRRT